MKHAGVNMDDLSQHFETGVCGAIEEIFYYEDRKDTCHIHRAVKHLEYAIEQGQIDHWDMVALPLIGRIWSDNPSCLMSKFLSIVTGIAHPHATTVTDMKRALLMLEHRLESLQSSDASLTP